MAEVIRDEDTGMTFEVVEPGSPSDPFSTNRVASSPAPAASPASPGQPGGAQTVLLADGPKIQTAQSSPAPAVAPAAVQSAAPATPEAELSPMQLAIKEGKLDEYVAGLVSEGVGKALRTQQGSYDRRINALQEEVRAAREAALKSEREGKLEELSSEEQEILKNKWAIEDERSALEADIDEADTYFRSMYVAMLIQSHGGFGVTAEELEQLEEPEEMDAYVTEKELDFYRSGKHLDSGAAQVPTRTTQAPAAASTNPEPDAPAGAQAPTDLGGGAPAAPPAQLSKETGIDAMAQNLNKLAWETVRVPA